MARYCNVLREKFSKYLGYIRDIKYDENKSMTVILGFPLEYMKILMLTLAESLI